MPNLVHGTWLVGRYIIQIKKTTITLYTRSQFRFLQAERRTHKKSELVTETVMARVGYVGLFIYFTHRQLFGVC